MKYFFKIAFEKTVVRTAFRVTLLVGVILNLINQGDLIIHLQWDKISYSKVVLTFAVPYLVSTYSAVIAKMENLN